MNLQELKTEHIRAKLGMSAGQFPRTTAFIDFANVNHWFDDDRYDLNGQPLSDDSRVEIDIKRLADFLGFFTQDARFYYGHDPANQRSIAFTTAARHVFGKHRVFTKRIQKVRHDLTVDDSVSNTRIVYSDDQGDFVWIPKCNFDVEIAVDAMRLVDSYDTICLLSGDADFSALIQHLKAKEGKKAILIKGGRIDGSLGKLIDLVINAHQIKQHTTHIKQKPGAKPGSADSQPESTGRVESNPTSAV